MWLGYAAESKSVSDSSHDLLPSFCSLAWHVQGSLPCAYSRPIAQRFDSLPVHVSRTDIFARPTLGSVLSRHLAKKLA